MIDTAAGARYYYFYDGLGSVAALSNANNAIVEAYCYDAFGRTKINTAAGPDGNWLTPDGTPAAASGYGNRFMFTGREYDSETDLYSCRARMYSPALGRFLQPDPIGYADSMNLYQYCGNNPINFIDPWGLCGQETPEEASGGDRVYVEGLTPQQLDNFNKFVEQWKSKNGRAPGDNVKDMLPQLYEEWLNEGQPSGAQKNFNKNAIRQSRRAAEKAKGILRGIGRGIGRAAKFFITIPNEILYWEYPELFQQEIREQERRDNAI